MNDDKPPAMMMMAPPWFHQPTQEYHGNEVPARVRVAMAFLNSLTEKTMTRGIATDVSCQEIEGMELLPVEHQTQASALHMLETYFDGNLRQSGWEEKEDAADSLVAVIDCPECFQKPSGKKCKLCEGRGKVGLSRLP